MLSLHELQSAMADGIYDDAAAGATNSIRAGRFPPERYLQIYRNNVFASLTQAMKDVFPVVTRLVSDGFMDYATDSFIRHHPPRSGNLHDFGAEFAAFLREFPPAQTLAYLPDVARLEWAYHEAFHAGEAQPRAAMKLQAIDPDRYGELCFVLHPSARLIASDFPILRIWEFNQPDYPGPETIDLNEGPAHVLLIRRDTQVELCAQSPAAFALLAAFDRGDSFAIACERALAAENEFDLSGSVQAFVLDETVIDVRTPPSAGTT